MDRVLEKKLKPVEEDGIEYCILDGFKDNRILFTAPHAFTSRIRMKKFGEGAYIGIGDKNTGKLARLAALHTNTAYIIPKVLRTEVDPSRPPEDLGKDLKLLVPILHSEKEKKTIYIPIHQNKSLEYILDRYHKLIGSFKPRGIVFIHGMHSRHKFDILLGFGENYIGINGKDKAFKFKKELINKTQRLFQKFGIKQELNIEVSKWLFVGKNNYPLEKYVIEYNKKHKKKRIGVNAEFNLRGRTSKEDKNLPTIRYQLALQTLADLTVEWNKKL